MNSVAKPTRIENAIDDVDRLMSLFRRNGPYGCLGVSVPEGVDPDTRTVDDGMSLPWFRGNWAVAGKTLVDGVDQREP